MKAVELHYHARRSIVMAERAKGPQQRISEKASALFALNETLTGLMFEKHGYSVNEPAAWNRLYGGLCGGYYRDFGWRSAFLGGSCE